MMKWVYIACSYVIIGIIGVLSYKHINNLSARIQTQQEELNSTKQSYEMVINAYNDEIKELQSATNSRKEKVREIVKVVKGTDDEKCLNSRIPSVVLDKVRNKNRN